jgi:hypothetical protein
MSVPDNGPVIAGTTWALTLLCGSFLGLRIYAKLSRKQRLWWDDYVLIVSWVCYLLTSLTHSLLQHTNKNTRSSSSQKQ